MNSKHTGAKLSRIKIASHLQKYRSDIKQGVHELELESSSSSPDASFDSSSFPDSLCLSPLSVSPDGISSAVENYPELNWILATETPTQSPEKPNNAGRQQAPPLAFYPPSVPVSLGFGTTQGCQVVANFCPACGRSLNGSC